MHNRLVTTLVCLCCLAESRLTAQVDPNKPGGSQATSSHAPHPTKPGNSTPAKGPAAGGAAHTTTISGGAHTTTAGGHTAGGTTASHTAIKSPAPKGTAEHATKDGSAIRIRSNGGLSDVHDAKLDMDVHHGLDGGRRVSVVRHDGSHLYSEPGRRGYVERGYHYLGHDYNYRAYYDHGREYSRYYRSYGYRGLYLNVYTPGYYYGTGFYGWAYNPWAAPITFNWEWSSSPWYAYYGNYFQPYAVYPSAAFWLVDYLISQDLQAAYTKHLETGPADNSPEAVGGPPVLTPEIKQKIADEVKTQLALENQEATQIAANQDFDPGSSGIARMLSDGRPHVFVVGGGLDLIDPAGVECAVSEGDVLELKTPPPSNVTAADLVVLASKGGKECQSGGAVSVNLTDLQEMQNHLRETIDTGLKELQSKQGKDGLPTAPPSAQVPPTESAFATVAPPPDLKDAADILQQSQQADAVETAIVSEASSDGQTTFAASHVAAAPVTVALGQSVDQVEAILGKPVKTANLGPKTIYYYDGMKVVFKGGKVSDVE